MSLIATAPRPCKMVIYQRKLTFQTNKYALREKIQIVSVKTGKKIIAV